MMTSSATIAKSGLSPISAVVEALEKRCPWHHLRPVLKKNELPVGMGWIELQSNASGKTQSAQKLDTFLRAFYSEHLLVGERYVQFYDLTEPALTSAIYKLQQAHVSPSAFSSIYPLPLSEKDLVNAPSNPTLVEVIPLQNNDWALIYCSSQSHHERLIQQFSQLSSVVQQIYSGYDEFIAIRKVYYQAFDVVYIRKSLERLEVCVDQPSKSGIDLDNRVLQILAAVAENIPDLQSVYTSLPWNVFSAIGGIFFAPKEGVVKKLSFRTPTGSAKTERMVSPKDDLRLEKFHDAGMDAVDNKISPYELIVEYDFLFPSGSAEIRLLASLRDASCDNPQLSGCYISCIDHPSLFQASNKVAKFIES